MRTPIVFLVCAAVVACDVKQDLGGDQSQVSPASGNTPKVATLDVRLIPSALKVTSEETVELLAEVDSDEAVVKVWFTINGAALPSVTAAPYRSDWPVERSENGVYSVIAKVKDSKGNTAQSDPVTIVVEIPLTPNEVPGPSGPQAVTGASNEEEPFPTEPQPANPSFVAASGPSKVTNTAAFSVATPVDAIAGDFLLAIVAARDEAGTLQLATPPGWNLLVGYPMRNRNDAHNPYIIPAEENIASWVMWRWNDAATPSSHPLVFSAQATLANASVVAYSDVDPITPIDVHVAYPLFGDGNTNGFGSGNTNRTGGTEVALIATAFTSWGQRTDVTTSVEQRVNSGETADGLNIVVHDTLLSSFKIHYGPSVRHKRLPANSTTSLLWNASMVVLNHIP